MGSATLVPVSEYLRTAYRPDCDYLEGELRERNMGERPHAALQGFLYFLFRLNRDTWKVQALPEQRVQVSEHRYRVPDVCVVRDSDPHDPIVHVAPLICIEVLSREDTLNELQERVNDYTSMGVQHVWAVNPWTRVGYICTRKGFLQPEDGFLRVPGTPIAIALAEVFAELDRVS